MREAHNLSSPEFHPGMAPEIPLPAFASGIGALGGAAPARLHPVTDKSLIRLILEKSPHYQNPSHS